MSPLYADSLHDRVFFQLSRILRKFPHLPDLDYVPHLFFFFFSPSSRFSLPSRFRMILVRIHLRINFQISILSFFVRSDGSFKVLPIYLLLLSLSLSLSFSLRLSLRTRWKYQDSNFQISIPVLFLPSLFSLDRMEVPRFESAYKSPTSLSPFSLPLSLPARLDENSKIRIHPNFQISKFPSPSFSFHSIGRTLAQAWSAYESLSSSSLLLSRPLRSVRTYFPPPVAPSPRLRSDSKVATRPGDPSAATRRALAELWTSGSEKARPPSRFR